MPQTEPKAAPAAATWMRGVAYHIEEIVPIERVPALANDAAMLQAFKAAGMKTFAESKQTLVEQAVSSAKKSLAAAKLTARDLDAIVVGTSEIKQIKRFPEMLATEMLMALELSDVPVVGVTVAGCANWSSMLRVARNMLVAEGMKHILVVETDQVRGDMQRQIYEDGHASVIFADGAASFILSAEDTSFRPLGSDFELVAMSQTIKPIDWTKTDSNGIAANNLFGFQHVLREVGRRAGVKSKDDFVKAFLPNINTQVVNDIAEVVGFPPVYMANCSRTAHVWSCDNLINLVDYCGAESAGERVGGRIPAGSLFLLVCNAESYFSAVVCRKR